MFWVCKVSVINWLSACLGWVFRGVWKRLMKLSSNEKGSPWVPCPWKRRFPALENPSFSASNSLPFGICICPPPKPSRTWHGSVCFHQFHGRDHRSRLSGGRWKSRPPGFYIYIYMYVWMPCECKINICLNDNYIHLHKFIDILEDICPTRGFCLGVISYRYACILGCILTCQELQKNLKKLVAPFILAIRQFNFAAIGWSSSQPTW